MKLQTYLTDKRVTYATFANMTGAANAGVVAKWVAGSRIPRPKFMAAIVRETGGVVQPNDFFSATPIVEASVHE